MASLYKKGAKRFLVLVGLAMLLLAVPLVYAAVEAPTGFDDHTNGLTSQNRFTLDREIFEEREGIADGLGPVYNAQSCAECHQNPVSGSDSQIEEIRVGRFDGTTFTNRPGGSLINDRAIDPRIQERVEAADNVRTLRVSLNLLGDGFVEAIPDSEFTRIRNAQPAGMKGTIIRVPVLEAPGTKAIGRFGWKNQHASLISFSADAYLNEMGITNPLFPQENTSNGRSVAAFDPLPETNGFLEDEATSAHPFGVDVEIFARFIRATEAPAPASDDDDIGISASPEERISGKFLFRSTGCINCHTDEITTAPEGTVINGGTFTVPAALGEKIIHPFGDFMLHDVGTGDGIVQAGGQETRNLIRTAPLWGLRTRTRLMHDGKNLTIQDAILRHTNEAEPVIQSYRSLTAGEKNQLLAFLLSL